MTRKQNGFTLVEIVVASLLLAIIAAGIFSVSLSSKKIIYVSSQRKMATDVAATVLENMRAYLGADNWSDTSSSNSLGSPFNAFIITPHLFNHYGWYPYLAYGCGIGAPTSCEYWNYSSLHEYRYDIYVPRIEPQFLGFFNNITDIFKGTEFDTRYNGRWRFRVFGIPGYEYRKVEVEVVWDEPEF